jgi:hypothetical protein
MEYRARERRRFILVLIVVSVMVVAGLITALILALLGNGDNTTPNLPASASTLYVQANSKDGAYPTWTQAVRMAKPGYRIVVRDPIIEWDGGVIEPRAIPDNLTIEPDVGKIVRWRLKPGIPPRAMLRLSNLKGFTLRGFIFDGEGRVQDLIALSGTCPGLTLEGLTLKGFDRSAISITNCQGSGDHPVRIMGLQIEAQPAKPVESAFSFAISKDIPSIPLNQHIHISDIRLDQGTNFTKGLVQPSGPDVLDKLIDRKTVILP